MPHILIWATATAVAGTGIMDFDARLVSKLMKSVKVIPALMFHVSLREVEIPNTKCQVNPGLNKLF